MGKLMLYGGKGHQTATWEVGEAEAVKEAERIFKEALEKGGAAFVLDQGVEGAHRIETFEETAQEIAVIFPVAGG